MHAGDARDRVAGFHGVGAAAAVHMQVDEAGQHDGRAVAHRVGRLRRAVNPEHTALGLLDAAAHEALRREDVSRDGCTPRAPHGAPPWKGGAASGPAKPAPRRLLGCVGVVGAVCRVGGERALGVGVHELMVASRRISATKP